MCSSLLGSHNVTILRPILWTDVGNMYIHQHILETSEFMLNSMPPVQCNIVTFTLALIFSICSPFQRWESQLSLSIIHLLIYSIPLYVTNLVSLPLLLCRHAPNLTQVLIYCPKILLLPPLPSSLLPSCQHGCSLSLLEICNLKLGCSLPCPSRDFHLTPTGL